MPEKPIRIGLCGWLSGSLTQSVVAQLDNLGAEVSWGILDQIDANMAYLVQHQCSESDLVAEISGRTIQNDWNISLADLAYYDHHIPMILRVQERWLVGDWNIDDRLFLIHNTIAYFVNFLKKKPVDVIFHSTASPHHFYNTVLTVVAESIGIQSLFINVSFITNKFNFVSGFKKLPVNFSSFKPDTKPYADYVNSILDNSDFRPKYIRDYFNWRASSIIYYFLTTYPLLVTRNIKAIFVRKNLGLRLYRGRLGLGILLSMCLDDLKSAYWLIRLKRFYLRHCVDEIHDGSVLLFANYQPEATSNPDGGEYPDLRYVVRSFDFSGKRLYFKEHPTMFNFSNGGSMSDIPCHRSFKFYSDLLEAGVLFVKPGELGGDLFKKADRVLSVTGTVAMEAAIKGIKSTVLGYSWYGDMPGVVRLDINKKDFPGQSAVALEKILDHFMCIDESSLDNILGVASNSAGNGISAAEFGSAILDAAKAVLNQRLER